MRKRLFERFCAKGKKLTLVICGLLLFAYLVCFPACSGKKSGASIIKDLRGVWSTVSVKAQGIVRCISGKGGYSPQEISSRTERLRQYLSGEMEKLKHKWGRESEVVDQSIKAMSAISSYLEKIQQSLQNLFTSDSEKKSQLEFAVVESATRARDSYEEVMRSLGKGLRRIDGEFFDCGSIIIATLSSSSEEKLPAQIKEIRNTVLNFMNADIKEYNPEILWALLSKKVHEVYAIFGVTKEGFAAKWRSGWKDSKPVDFAISARQIEVGEDGRAHVPVVVYLEKGSPIVQEVGLIFEDGTWKVERYPFVGILGTENSPFEEPKD